MIEIEWFRKSSGLLGKLSHLYPDPAGQVMNKFPVVAFPVYDNSHLLNLFIFIQITW
jgi:hypothetical protein